MGERIKEWLSISSRLLTWMIKRMVSLTKRKHALGEAGWLENIEFSFEHTEFETHSGGAFHVCSWVLHRKEEDKN